MCPGAGSIFPAGSTPGAAGAGEKNIGNEAKIEIEYPDFESIATESRKYT